VKAFFSAEIAADWTRLSRISSKSLTVVSFAGRFKVPDRPAQRSILLVHHPAFMRFNPSFAKHADDGHRPERRVKFHRDLVGFVFLSCS